MKVSYSWIKDYINIDEPVDKISKRLTASGLEVEGVEEFETLPGGLKGIVIGEVKTCRQHENADKLSVTTVDIGTGEDVQIVCGAPNVADGQKVLVATVGATLYPEGEEPFKIKKSKIRGEESLGMICAEDELGLGNSHDGIIVLNTDLPAGTEATKIYDVAADEIIEIGLTPNRADATGAYGVAREIAALTGVSLKEIAIGKLPKSDNSKTIEVIVKNEAACPRYTGVLIDNITIAPSPEWLQNRLKSIGVSSINNVVDITNYVLHDLGQPLHAFDASKITSNKVVVQNLAEGTLFTTLDDVERKLKANDLVICNDNEPMCLAGVFGGKKSGVSNETTSIFLESAYFSTESVRKTSLVHAIKTDSSFRFERGCDPNITLVALRKAASLICEIAGGKISSEFVDIYPNPIQNFIVEAKYSNINRLIGKELSKDTIKNILISLEISIEKESDNELTLSVPPYRVDVQREADIIEEILRVYGYDNIEESSALKSDFLAPLPKNNTERKKVIIAETLAGLGYQEIFTNSLTKPSYSEDLENFNNDENVVILNRLSEDLGIMRRTLLFNGLEVIDRNSKRRQKNLNLFEFGKSYSKTETGYAEQEWLALFNTGNKLEESWLEKDQKTDFFTLASAVKSVLLKVGHAEIKEVPTTNELLEAGIDLFIKKQYLGSIGIVKSKIASKAEIKNEVWYAELNATVLLGKNNKEMSFSEISKFPEVRRDLSLVIDKKVSFDEIKQIAQKVERKLLRDINVFDTYEGDNLGEGKKSYSVSFALQDNEKTLNDKIIDKTMSKLMEAFKNELGAIIRG